MKIFVIGKIRGENRSQLLLNLFSRECVFQAKYPIKISYFRRSRLNKILYCLLLLFIFDFVRALRSDKIFYLAMNQEKLLHLFFLKIFQKEIILDFYTSRLLFACSAKKLDGQCKACSFLKYWYLYIVDKLRLLLPTKVIFLNSSHASYLGEEFNVSHLENKAIVVPLVVPDYLHNRRDASRTEFNVCWWGKASLYHGLEFLMDEIAEVCNNVSQVRFYFFESDAQRALRIKEIAMERGVNSDFIVIRSDLTFRSGLGHWLIDNCDLALGTFGFLPGSELGIANKTLEAWSLALPICTQRTKDVCPGNSTGAYLDELKRGAVKALIIEACFNKTLNNIDIKEIATNARAVYERHYSVKAFENSIIDILK